MTVSRFVGPIPLSLDPERTGWPFRGADLVFGQRGLRDQITIWNKGRDADNGIIIYADGMDPAPPVQVVWWAKTDRTLPYLIWELLSGECRAFGDPEKAGAYPEWIEPRLWRDLKQDPENDRLFSGGGRVYWNVRVVAAGEIHWDADLDTESTLEDGADKVSAGISGATSIVSKGGRPPLSEQKEFIRELIRLADLSNLPDDPSDLLRYMKEWVAEKFLNGGPSDTTIRSWVAQYDYRRF